MNILSETKKREEKEQKEAAEKLIKIADEVVDFLKARNLQVWEVKTIHSLLGQKLTQMLTVYVEKKDLNEIL